MGVKELREGFNAVAGPAYRCTLAVLDYERVGGREWQVLSFSGKAAGGSAFEIRSGRLGVGVDLVMAARETAQRLLDKGEPQS